jgi:hypothetical protein
MKRMQLVEIEDQPWCPRAVRDGSTDWLRFMADVSRAFVPAAAHLERAFAAIGKRRVIDLCSGGGGPWLSLSRALPEAEIELSDLYPNLPAFRDVSARSQGRVRFREEAVDATNVPVALDGVRTMFNSFHHLPPPLARAVLQDAVNKRRPIAIFEGFSHRGLGMGFMALQIPLLLLLTPFVRPWSLSRFVLTYAVPAIPMLVAFDGTASMFRLYLGDEMRALIASVDGHERFDWDVGTTRMPHLPLGVAHAVGVPRPR